MKISIIFTLAIVSFLLTGCSKDAEVNAFISEFEAATSEIVQKIESDPSSAGVEAATNAFNARKPQLKSKWDEIKGAVGIQVTAETKKRLETSVANNMKELMEFSIRNSVKLSADREATIKFKQLLQDYSSTFAMTGKQG